MKTFYVVTQYIAQESSYVAAETLEKAKEIAIERTIDLHDDIDDVEVYSCEETERSRRANNINL